MSCLTCLPSNSSRIFNEIPDGELNCVNLDFSTSQRFDPNSLIVRLDGIVLEPIQYSVGVDEKSFSLIVDPSNPKALNEAPRSEESLRIDYNTKPDTDCLTIL